MVYSIITDRQRSLHLELYKWSLNIPRNIDSEEKYNKRISRSKGIEEARIEEMEVPSHKEWKLIRGNRAYKI